MALQYSQNLSVDEDTQTGFVRECAWCGDLYVDTVSPVPPRDISDIPFRDRESMECGGKTYLEIVKYETRYGFCDSCAVPNLQSCEKGDIDVRKS